MTSLPEKRDRSTCSEQCEANSRGIFANVAGTLANGWMPAATIVQFVWTVSPSASVTLKLPFFSTPLTQRRSISGTDCYWNQRPYSTNLSNGTGLVNDSPVAA